MADLKIPNLNKNSAKYIFKKKLTLRRKSKKKLINESFIMIFFGIMIIYINYLIPNKISIFSNIVSNFNKLIINIFNSFSYIYEISLAIFIFVSVIVTSILFLGASYRFIKILKRKSNTVSFK